MSGVSVTSASQILESFWNIWSRVSQRKKPFSDFPARGKTDCRPQTADRRLQTTDCRPAADCRPQIADCKLKDTKNLPNKGDTIKNITSCESEKVAWEQG